MKSVVLRNYHGLSAKHVVLNENYIGKIYLHDEVQLNLNEKGSLHSLSMGQKITTRPGQLRISWPLFPTEIRSFEKGACINFLTIPLGNFLQWKLPAEFVSSILRGVIFFEPDNDQGQHDLNLMHRWQNDLARKSDEFREIVLLEVEARVRRLAQSVSIPSLSGKKTRRITLTRPVAGAMGNVIKMANFIARSHTQDITISDIAKDVDLNPKYAITLFRKVFGRTLHDYLVQHRISHARRLLVTTNEKILDIALKSGFTSVSRFYEVFMSECKCSPGAYRKSFQER